VPGLPNNESGRQHSRGASDFVNAEGVDLKGLGFPRTGDYSLEVLADGDRLGSIDVFSRPARLEPMGDG
jgi:hypothetical protein